MPFYEACENPEIIRNRYKACLACVGFCQKYGQFSSGIGSLPCISLNGSAIFLYVTLFNKNIIHLTEAKPWLSEQTSCHP